MSDQTQIAGLSVSRETIERLKVYEALLRKWNPAINLVSKSTLDDLWARHIVDSAQVFALAANPTGKWADLGSGAGFPGMVAAILAAELMPGLAVTCVESDQRNSTFLRQVARATGVSAAVVVERIENVAPLHADILSARALAPLHALCGFAERHLKPEGIAFFPKGTNFRAEVSEALENWSFDVEEYASVTAADAVVLKLENIRRV